MILVGVMHCFCLFLMYRVHFPLSSSATQTSTKKINYRLIHRTNVHSNHALCVNAHIQTIANSLSAEKETSIKKLKVEPASFTSCPVHVCYVQLAPSPFALVAAVDQDILETSLSREKLDLIVHTCTTRVSNIYKNLSILNEVYAKPLNSNVEARKSTKQSDNRVRLIELSDRNASTVAKNIEWLSSQNLLHGIGGIRGKVPKMFQFACLARL